MTQALRLKHFRSEGCLSYLIHDQGTGEALIIDPSMGMMEEYRSHLLEKGLKLRYVLETHTHADHFSASHLLRNEHQARIGMSEKSGSQRPTLRLKDGDEFRLGTLEVKVLETPGHTPDSVTYCLSGDGAGGKVLVFTGDTLFIGGTGRTDFEGADPARLYQSLKRILETVPGSALILPGHDYSDHLFSSLEIERRQNPHLQIPSQELFVEMKRAESIPVANGEVRRRIDFNNDVNPTTEIQGERGGVTPCGVATDSKNSVASISVQKYLPKIEAREPGVLFVDVREPDEYREGHIPKTRNIPLSELCLNFSDLKSARRVYVSCQSGMRSGIAAKTLSYLGLPDVVNVTGGFRAWSQAGFPVESEQG